MGPPSRSWGETHLAWARPKVKNILAHGPVWTGIDKGSEEFIFHETMLFDWPMASP
jgi:hypothetical protein